MIRSGRSREALRAAGAKMARLLLAKIPRSSDSPRWPGRSLCRSTVRAQYSPVSGLRACSSISVPASRPEKAAGVTVPPTSGKTRRSSSGRPPLEKPLRFTISPVATSIECSTPIGPGSGPVLLPDRIGATTRTRSLVTGWVSRNMKRGCSPGTSWRSISTMLSTSLRSIATITFSACDAT